MRRDAARMNNRLAVVTGAGSGIGEAIALTLAASVCPGATDMSLVHAQPEKLTNEH